MNIKNLTKEELKNIVVKIKLKVIVKKRKMKLLN